MRFSIEGENRLENAKSAPRPPSFGREAEFRHFGEEGVVIGVANRLEAELRRRDDVRFEVVDQEDFVRLEVGDFLARFGEGDFVNFAERFQHFRFEAGDFVGWEAAAG